MGHLIDKEVGASSDGVIRSIIDTNGKKGIELGLSKYAADNMSKDFGSPYSEVVAEAWRDYKCADKPRKIAVSIGKRIEELAKNKMRNKDILADFAKGLQERFGNLQWK